jgi:hypothetical protein
MKWLLITLTLLCCLTAVAQENPVILIVKDQGGTDSIRLQPGDFILYSKSIDKPKVRAVVEEIHPDKLLLTGLRSGETYERPYTAFYNLSILPVNTKTFKTRRIFGFTSLGIGLGALAITTRFATLNKPFQPCDEDLPTRFCGSPTRTIRNLVLAGGLTIGGVIPLAMNARAVKRFTWMNAPVFEVIEIPPFESK